MTLEEAQAHVGRLAEAINTKDLERMLGLYSDRYVAHASGKRAVLRGKEDLARWITGQWTAFPDIRFTGEVLAVGGDSYTCLYSNTGTQAGTFAGKASTGRRFEAWGLYLAKVRDGKMVESWTAFDDLGMRTQLGLVPER